MSDGGIGFLVMIGSGVMVCLGLSFMGAMWKDLVNLIRGKRVEPTLPYDSLLFWMIVLLLSPLLVLSMYYWYYMFFDPKVLVRLGLLTPIRK